VVIQNTDDRSVSVAWEYSCNLSKALFKVYIEHVEWKACQTGRKDTAKGPGT
jgi:hypothetical protein